MSLMFTTKQPIATLSSPNISWGEVGQVIHFLSLPQDFAQKTLIQVTWLRGLAGSGWGAGAKTLRTSALSLVYSNTEYCTPVWCHNMHTRLIDSILNDALRIVTGCLHSTPMEDLPVLTGIQPAELCRLGVTHSFANCATHDPGHVLHGQLVGWHGCAQGET